MLHLYILYIVCSTLLFSTHLCLGHRFPRFQFDLESFSALQDNVALQLVVLLVNVSLHPEVPHDGGQQDLELQHGVFAALQEQKDINWVTPVVY